MINRYVDAAFENRMSRSHFIIGFESGGVLEAWGELNHVNKSTRIIKAHDVCSIIGEV